VVIKLSFPEPGGFWEIPVLYEDKDLLVLNKPAGLPVLAGQAEGGRAALMDMLQSGIAQGKSWATARSLSFLKCAHRLDSEATGILLLTKNKPALVTLLDVFGSEKPTLAFVALVHRASAQNRFSSEAKVGAHPVRAGQMRVDAKLGKRARTSFEVIERFQGWTLLKCVPLTHRFHQIRVQLSRLGLSVAGDEIYGGKSLRLSSLKPGYHLKPKHTEQPLISRPCLHAEKLEIPHPITGQSLSVIAPWPKNLVVAVRYLRKFAAA
jgi:RluA family pseudouridine synthase